MALTPEEEQELQDLEAQQSQLQGEYESLKKEFAPVEEGPDTSMSEALLRSGAQGLSLGFADEATAGLESAFTGKPYEKALEESRAEYKASEEQYPTTSLLGEIGGGVGQAVALTALTGGAGAPAAAATGAKTLSNIAKLGKIARAAFIPTVEKSALKNIGTAALSGATYGALTEAGKSEEEGLGRLKEAPMAALTGAAVGGALGGVLEGGKKVVGAASETLEKLIKEGNVPPSVKKVVDIWKAGTEKKGYTTAASTKRVDDAIEQAAEDAVDVIQNNINQARQVKQQILSQVDKPIKIDTSLERLAENLTKNADIGLSDASPILNRIQKIAEQKLQPDSSALSAVSLNDMINKLDDILQEPRQVAIQKDVRNTLRQGIDELKTKLRLQIDSRDVQKVLDQNPELKQIYSQYVKNIAIDSLESSPVLSEYEKKFMSGLKRSSTVKNKKLVEQGIDPEKLAEKEKQKAFKTLAKEPNLKGKSKKIPEMSPEEIAQQESDIASMLSEISDMSKQNPLGQLDHVMHNILNASEKLGIKETLSARYGSPDALKSKFKIFDVLRGNTSETGAGQKAVMKYREAVDDLTKANPDIAKQFKDVTEPAVLDLENKKFLEGTRLGEGPRDTGALRTLITAPAVGIAYGGNLAAQIGKSKTAQTVLRPTVALLQGIKKNVDDTLVVDPSNPVLKFVSESLDNALKEKDESRRAAILNTMMQYESIRKLFKGDGNE